jgi:nicotinic acid mononucleotide adenylyltransferase
MDALAECAEWNSAQKVNIQMKLCICQVPGMKLMYPPSTQNKVGLQKEKGVMQRGDREEVHNMVEKGGGRRG